MTNREDIEKVRQEIMRFRELLNIMTKNVQDGERAYASLFNALSEEDKKSLKEKDLQWKAAELIINDLTAFGNAVLGMRFKARELEKCFEELYDIIVTEPNPEE